MDIEKKFRLDKDERVWVFTSRDLPGVVLRSTDLEELIDRAERTIDNRSEKQLIVDGGTR